MSPTPLGPSRWYLDPTQWPDDDCVAAGADLEPETVVEAYRQGAFPMPHGGTLLWWSPMRRGVLTRESLHVSRSLRRSMRRFTTTVDESFDEVVAACADPRRPGAWITPAVAEAYGRLHRLGWAHSVETRDEDGRLVGGLYGLAVGGLFAGESMFHHETDASKAALVALVGLLDADALVDVQWQTPHLASLGVHEWARTRYLRTLPEVTAAPLPSIWR